MFFLPFAIGLVVFVSVVTAFSQKARDESKLETKAAPRGRLLALLDRGTFDISTNDGLVKLLETAGTLEDLSEKQAAAAEQRRKEMLASKPSREMTFEELKKYYMVPPQVISKKDRRGLQEDPTPTQ